MNCPLVSRYRTADRLAAFLIFLGLVALGSLR